MTPSQKKNILPFSLFESYTIFLIMIQIWTDIPSEVAIEFKIV